MARPSDIDGWPPVGKVSISLVEVSLAKSIRCKLSFVQQIKTSEFTDPLTNLSCRPLLERNNIEDIGESKVVLIVVILRYLPNSKLVTLSSDVP